MKFKKLFPYLLLVLLAVVYLVISGDPLSAKVSGKVYWNDELISLEDSHRGKVVFRPVDGGANCSGLIDSEGNYSIGTGGQKAIVPGDYLIAVSVVSVERPNELDGLPGGIPVTPTDYANPLSSGLTLMVKRGENVHDIRIEGPAYVPPVVESDNSDDELSLSDPENGVAEVQAEERVKEEKIDSAEESVSSEDITAEIKEEVTE